MTNVEFLDAALGQVESESIREWANSDHNRPIFEKMAQGAIDKRGEEADPVMFSAYVVSLAMGL